MNGLPAESAYEILRFDGFLLLRISEKTRETIQNTFSEGYAFFRSALDTKMASRLPADTGYRPFAGEYSQSPDRPDQVESFSASVRMSAAACNLQSNTAQSLYKSMLKVVAEFEPIAEQIILEIARAIKGTTEHNLFNGAFSLWSFAQLNYSLPAKTQKEFINDLHEDGCLLTMTCTTGPGLEIRTHGGQFVRVTTEPDEILIFPGEILWLLSGGLLAPLHHRVRPHAECQERMSLLFFADIAPHLCHPWSISDVNREVDIGQRVLKNPTRFGLGEWTWK
jgi:isopenicillin N synthase-like dioxygenase